MVHIPAITKPVVLLGVPSDGFSLLPQVFIPAYILQLYVSFHFAL